MKINFQLLSKILITCSVLAILPLIYCLIKVRDIIRWRYRNTLEDSDIDRLGDSVKDVVGYSGPLQIVLNYLTKVVVIGAILLVILSMSYLIINKGLTVPTEKTVEMVEGVLTNMYCTSPSNMDKVWVEDVKPHVSKDILYKLNMTNLDNVTQRHQGWNSDRTLLKIHNYSSDNEIILLYTIINPAGGQVKRMSVFKVVGETIEAYSEYNLEGTNVVNYSIGES